MSNGIVYITIKDKKYTEYAYVSIESLRKTGYSGDICIITDSDDRSIKNVTYKQIPVSPDNPLTASRFLKTKLNTLSPFDTTLYLDCDTLVLNPIDSIWQYSKNNFNICRDHRFFLCDVNFFDIVGDQHELIKTKVHFPPDTPYYAGSVFMWNNSIDGNDVFTHWHDEWNVFKNTDQLALARAAFKNKLVIIW